MAVDEKFFTRYWSKRKLWNWENRVDRRMEKRAVSLECNKIGELFGHPLFVPAHGARTYSLSILQMLPKNNP